MATHSSTLAWKIPWTEEPGGLQSMGSRGVGYDWATSLSLLTFIHWRRKWQPTPVSLPGESQGWRSLVGCGVAQSQTRPKRLSTSSSSGCGARASHWGGLCWCRTQALGLTGFSTCSRWAQWSWHMGFLVPRPGVSSMSPALARGFLTNWTTSKVSQLYSYLNWLGKDWWKLLEWNLLFPRPAYWSTQGQKAHDQPEWDSSPNHDTPNPAVFPPAHLLPMRITVRDEHRT